MKITLLGYILIPLGIILLPFKEKYLLLITLFFAPFTASSVLNIESITFGLQPSNYFGVLFLLRELLVILRKMRITKVNIWLFSFMIFSTFSLIMLIVYLGSIEVWYAESGFYMLRPTIHNFTQLAYLIFCFVIYVFTKNFIKRNENIENLINKLINVQIYSLTFVCFWGIYQFISGRFGFPFLTVFTQREGVHISSPYVANILKINSVAPEASMLALYLAPMLGFIYILSRKKVKLNIYFLLILTFLVGILTISTSFLIGTLLLVGLILGENLSIKSYSEVYISKKRILLLFLSIALFGIICLLTFSHIRVIIDTSLAKMHLSEFSGIDRLNQFLMGIRIFKESNFLGVGFGTIRTTDLFSTLLANVGVMGVFLLFGFIIKIYLDLKEISKYSYIAKCYTYYFIIFFGIAFISVSEMFFLYLWINIAIAEIIIHEQKIIIKNSLQGVNDI